MKTKSAKYAKMRRGEYQSAICPYGYQKSADGRMEPDKEAAEIVSQMFLWALTEIPLREIVRRLYAQRVPTPAEYRAPKENLSMIPAGQTVCGHLRLSYIS